MRCEVEKLSVVRGRPAAALLPVLLAALSGAAAAQAPAPAEPLAEEVVVFESSILLQRSGRLRAENLVVAVEEALAEAVAVYPAREIGLSTTVYFDVCAPSFSRLTHAVGMVAAVAEQLQALGAVSVITSNDEQPVLLEASRDRLDLEAALAVVLRSPLGGCEHTAPPNGLARMRRALARLAPLSTAPSLLLAYGFDHQTLAAEDLQRFEKAFGDAGRRLAGEGRTLVVLLPEEDDTRLREEEIRPLLGNPEDPPRTIDLGAVLGFLRHRKEVVPDDRRILALATDPRNELLRQLIAPGQGRLYAFPRRLEAFVAELADYQVLFYRSRIRGAERAERLVAIEVRTRGGEVVPTAAVASRGRPASAATD